jgi:hypothetical protein
MKSYIDYKAAPGEGVYIAGPMRGLPNNNEKAFFDAESWLVSRGYLVLNPLRISRSIAPDEVMAESPMFLGTVIEIEKRLLEHCTYIYLLRGWEKSVGARDELAVAMRLGVKILLQEDEEEGL